MDETTDKAFAWTLAALVVFGMLTAGALYFAYGNNAPAPPLRQLAKLEHDLAHIYVIEDTARDATCWVYQIGVHSPSISCVANLDLRK